MPGLPRSCERELTVAVCVCGNRRGERLRCVRACVRVCVRVCCCCYRCCRCFLRACAPLPPCVSIGAGVGECVCVSVRSVRGDCVGVWVGGYAGRWGPPKGAPAARLSLEDCLAGSVAPRPTGRGPPASQHAPSTNASGVRVSQLGPCTPPLSANDAMGDRHSVV
jgi:hypothetical protein